VTAPAPPAYWQGLRVAVNAVCLWRPLTGIGQYALNLAREWAREGLLLPQYFYGASWSPVAEPRTAPGLGAFKHIFKRLVPSPYETVRAVRQRAFDLIPGPFDVYLEPNFVPFRFEGPIVLTVHDLSHVRHPETHPAERVRILSEWLPPAMERAAHILTVSEFQRREIMDVFGIDGGRVTACHNGVGAEFRPRPEPECAAVLQRHGLRYRGYALVVGTLEPRKNLIAALDAYAQLPDSMRRRCPLVVAGMHGWKTGSFAPRLRTLARSGSVQPLGFVDDAELPFLYAGARVFLYPSLYEGFGLPALEAMASGVPVIASNLSCMPEVVGAAGRLVDPRDPAAIRRAIEELHDDAQAWARCAQQGLERARDFTWARTAAATATVLARAAGR
jgi:alpha-1,3-rhamnosyl/mannosyltransferase